MKKRRGIYPLIILLIAVIMGIFFFVFNKPQLSQKEQACINSGGTITTSLCCGNTNDFPNLCTIGACGCAPNDSHNIKICDCGNKCFNGTECAVNLYP